MALKRKISLKHVVREMAGRGNVRSGKCPSGEMYSRGSVRSGNGQFREMSVRGNVRRESVSRGIVLGEVSVGELPSRGTVRIPLRFYELCKSR